MKKWHADVYRTAAMQYAEGSEMYSCVTVRGVARAKFKLPFSEAEMLVNAYSELFAPTENSWGAWLHRAYVKEDRPLSPAKLNEMKEWRLTALCFMAAVAEYEGEDDVA